MYVPYIVPSENGNRTDVNFLQFDGNKSSGAVTGRSESLMKSSDADKDCVGVLGDDEGSSPSSPSLPQSAFGHALRICSSIGSFNFSVQPFTTEDLSIATHSTELEAFPRNFYSLNLDAHLMGLGGDDSWTACVHDEYVLPSDQQYEMAYTLSFPVLGSQGPL